jgi:DNA-binding NtrC family response regulator
MRRFILQKVRLLIIDDDAADRRQVKVLASGLGYEVVEAGNGAEALTALDSESFSVMITDLRMPQMDGLELIRHLKAEGTLPPTLVLTAYGNVELAVATVHELGVFWFLEKPVDAQTLELLVDRASTHGRLQSEVHELRRELTFHGALGEMVGQSESMRKLFAMLRQVAPTTAAVLITGESGTGKELVARAIHTLSKRSNYPFVAVNCAALPETLIESELFGHEKGSFTGAVERRTGCIEMAECGTLFLDEIAEMPVSMQAKLLRVLEDFKYRRIGGKQELKADVRIVAATNRDPKAAIAEGKLREDLFYRLGVFHIELPPLRERLDDIPVLAAALIERLNTKHNTKVVGLDRAVLAQFKARDWHGNIREFRNALERAVILAGEGLLAAEHFLEAPRPVVHAAADSNLDIRVGLTIDEAEQALIHATLQQTANNKTRAASILGISAKTLHVKLKQYSLESEEAPAAVE